MAVAVCQPPCQGQPDWDKKVQGMRLPSPGTGKWEGLQSQPCGQGLMGSQDPGPSLTLVTVMLADFPSLPDP